MIWNGGEQFVGGLRLDPRLDGSKVSMCTSRQSYLPDISAEQLWEPNPHPWSRCNKTVLNHHQATQHSMGYHFSPIKCSGWCDRSKAPFRNPVWMFKPFIRVSCTLKTFLPPINTLSTCYISLAVLIPKYFHSVKPPYCDDVTVAIAYRDSPPKPGQR